MRLAPRRAGFLSALLCLGLASGCGQATLPEADSRYLDGRPLATSQLRGQAAWLEFWAPWDPASRQRLLDLRELTRRNPSWAGPARLLLVAVGKGAEAEAALGAVDGRALPALLDDGALAQALGVTVLPATVWVAPEGRFRVLRQGYVEPRLLLEDLRPYLGAPPAGS